MRPEPPILGGGLSPQEWLRSVAWTDRHKGANFRAIEAERIADWIDELTQAAWGTPRRDRLTGDGS
jgi:hypothetical protein